MYRIRNIDARVVVDCSNGLLCSGVNDIEWHVLTKHRQHMTTRTWHGIRTMNNHESCKNLLQSGINVFPNVGNGDNKVTLISNSQLGTIEGICVQRCNLVTIFKRRISTLKNTLEIFIRY